MLKAFEDAVAAMDPGDISAPVQTQYGWHVIRLNETRSADAPPLEQVRPQLEQQVRQAAVQAFIDAQVDAGDVTRIDASGIDISVINNLGLLAD